MNMPLIVALLAGSLAGCAVADFAQRQSDWNAQHGMGSMNGPPMIGGPSTTVGAPTADDAETQRRIKQGEDLENEEARKAGFGPSPTEGMNCATTSSYSGSANSGNSTSNTSCHN